MTLGEARPDGLALIDDIHCRRRRATYRAPVSGHDREAARTTSGPAGS